MLFRCEASPWIGAGHVMRCLAFAETLQWLGWNVVFATSHETLGSVPALSANGCRIVADASSLPDEHFGAVVIDNYKLAASDEARHRGAATKVIVFDDLADRDHDCDLLVDPTPGRDPGDYLGRLPAGSRLLIGARYAMLGSRWRKWRAATLARLRRGGEVERIVVSMGATDPQNATTAVLRAIETSGYGGHVDVLLATSAPHLYAVAEHQTDTVRLHVGAHDIASLVAAADLAIGAPGSSSFERALLGIPSVLIPTADNQSLVARGFALTGAARVLSPDSLDDQKSLARAFGDAVADSDWRASASRAAAGITDGRGPQRLLLELVGRTLTKAGAVTLRIADQADEAWLLKLQHQPATRRYARNSERPTVAEHSRWLTAAVDDAALVLMVIELNGRQAGMVRLNQIRDGFEVSIAIDEELHGLGVGRATLGLVRRAAPGVNLAAAIRDENTASRALFYSAGYLRGGDGLYWSAAHEQH